VIALPRGASRRDKDELAFLPAALEIVETPPSPLGRAIGLTIVVLFCLALAWASLGNVDIIASAPGKIIPSGRTKVLQPFETGVVRAIQSKITYLETLDQLVDQQQERKVQESRHREAEAALAAIIKTIAQAEAEYHRTLSAT
jgi:hypothetical protein